MRSLESLQSLVSELSIVSASLSQYIPLYSYMISIEPSWTPFPRRGDGVVVGVGALLAVIVAIDFLQFAGAPGVGS